MSQINAAWQGVLRIHDMMSQLGAWVGAAALGLIVVIFTYEVTMRYFLGAPTYWASDFVAFLLLVSVFFYLPWLTRQGGNIAVTLLPDMMPARASQLLLGAGFLVAGAVCLWSAQIGWYETERLFRRNTMTLTTVRLPKWIFLMIITYGLGNAGLHFLRLAMSSLVRKELDDNA